MNLLVPLGITFDLLSNIVREKYATNYTIANQFQNQTFGEDTNAIGDYLFINNTEKAINASYIEKIDKNKTNFLKRTGKAVNNYWNRYSDNDDSFANYRTDLSSFYANSNNYEDDNEESEKTLGLDAEFGSKIKERKFEGKANDKNAGGMGGYDTKYKEDEEYFEAHVEKLDEYPIFPGFSSTGSEIIGDRRSDEIPDIKRKKKKNGKRKRRRKKPGKGNRNVQNNNNYDQEKDDLYEYSYDESTKINPTKPSLPVVESTKRVTYESELRPFSTSSTEIFKKFEFPTFDSFGPSQPKSFYQSYESEDSKLTNEKRRRPFLSKKLKPQERFEAEKENKVQEKTEPISKMKEENLNTPSPLEKLKIIASGEDVQQKEKQNVPGEEQRNSKPSTRYNNFRPNANYNTRNYIPLLRNEQIPTQNFEEESKKQKSQRDSNNKKTSKSKRPSVMPPSSEPLKSFEFPSFESFAPSSINPDGVIKPTRESYQDATYDFKDSSSFLQNQEDFVLPPMIKTTEDSVGKVLPPMIRTTEKTPKESYETRSNIPERNNLKEKNSYKFPKDDQPDFDIPPILKSTNIFSNVEKSSDYETYDYDEFQEDDEYSDFREKKQGNDKTSKNEEKREKIIDKLIKTLEDNISPGTSSKEKQKEELVKKVKEKLKTKPKKPKRRRRKKHKKGPKDQNKSKRKPLDPVPSINTPINEKGMNKKQQSRKITSANIRGKNIQAKQRLLAEKVQTLQNHALSIQQKRPRPRPNFRSNPNLKKMLPNHKKLKPPPQPLNGMLKRPPLRNSRPRGQMVRNLTPNKNPLVHPRPKFSNRQSASKHRRQRPTNTRKRHQSSLTPKGFPLNKHPKNQKKLRRPSGKQKGVPNPNIKTRPPNQGKVEDSKNKNKRPRLIAPPKLIKGKLNKEAKSKKRRKIKRNRSNTQIVKKTIDIDRAYRPNKDVVVYVPNKPAQKNYHRAPVTVQSTWASFFPGFLTLGTLLGLGWQAFSAELGETTNLIFSPNITYDGVNITVTYQDNDNVQQTAQSTGTQTGTNTNSDDDTNTNTNTAPMTNTNMPTNTLTSNPTSSATNGDATITVMRRSFFRGYGGKGRLIQGKLKDFKGDIVYNLIQNRNRPIDKGKIIDPTGPGATEKNLETVDPDDSENVKHLLEESASSGIFQDIMSFVFGNTDDLQKTFLSKLIECRRIPSNELLTFSLNENLYDYGDFYCIWHWLDFLAKYNPPNFLK